MRHGPSFSSVGATGLLLSSAVALKFDGIVFSAECRSYASVLSSKFRGGCIWVRRGSILLQSPGGFPGQVSL